MVKRRFILVVLLLGIFSSFSFSEDYKRIVSLNLSGDEMLLSLVNHDKIVALSGKINEDSDMSNVAEEAKKFPKVEKNLEALLNYEPDLVVGADWIDSGFIQSVQDTGIELYLYRTPRTIRDQEKVILEMGRFLHEEEKSKKLVAEMEEKLHNIQAKIKSLNIEDKPRVMLYTTFETTSDEKTSFNDLVENIYAINPVVGSGVNSFQKISKEKVIELDPDVIIVPTWTSTIDSDKFFRYLTNDPSLQDIKAIKNKRIYGIPYKKLSPTSQYMVDGVVELANKVYGLEEEDVQKRED